MLANLNLFSYIDFTPYLGNFRLTAQSTTVKDPKVFNVDNIKELKLQFNPDKSIKKTIQSFPLKKVK